jgi:hypothetical protein
MTTDFKKFIKHKNKYKKYSKKDSKKASKKYSKKVGEPATKFNNTYYLDSCFIVNAEDKWLFMDRLLYHLHKIGLKEDPLMKQIMNNDIKYLRSKHIAFDTEKCLSDYNIPVNFNQKLLRPMFLFSYEYTLDKRYINSKSKLMNMLNVQHAHNILLKNELYNNMKAKNPEFTAKHMAVTFMIDDVTKYKFPKHYILRPIYERFNGIFRTFYYMTFISNKTEYDKIIEFYNENNYDNKIIASEYIMNPLLFKGKKCHIRMNYLITVVNNKVRCFLSEYGRVFTAVDKFDTTTLPFTRDMHLSIFGGTRNDLIFPDVFNDENLNVKVDTNDIMRQMRECMKIATSLIDKSNPTKFINLNIQDNGYNLCGVEFLVDDTGNVFLLEINKPHGLSFHNRDVCEFFNNYLFDWIADCILYPLFKGTDATKHPTYLDPI